jgi:hypothetical protein
VRSYLESNQRFGKRLGRLLLERYEIELGRTWALVPANAAPDSLVNFESSVFPPAGPGEKVGVGYMVAVFDASSNAAMQAALDGLLAKPRARPSLLVVESALDRRTDGWDQPERQVFFCGDDVYDYALAEDPQAEVAWVPRGATWTPDVGIVTALPAALQSIEDRDSVSPAVLEEMAAAAVAIIVGAWDNEAPLFWESNADSQNSRASAQG